ncbi:type II secretion system protein [Vibrio aphrogenes]|uniref:type II secretion system protein n=1 Tax=Vibrio aphrogenes TaxID=1891186 RepID=UPI0038CD324C
MIINTNQKGFTLIELVVVIVILGILAVTAAPKFLDIQTDARHSIMHGLKGAMKDAVQEVYGKAVIQDKEHIGDTSTGLNGTACVKLNEQGQCGILNRGKPSTDDLNAINTQFGYPAFAVDLSKVVDGLEGITDDGLGLENIDNGQYKMIGSTESTRANQNYSIFYAGSNDPDFKNINNISSAPASGCYLTYSTPIKDGEQPIITLSPDCESH